MSALKKLISVMTMPLVLMRREIIRVNASMVSVEMDLAVLVLFLTADITRARSNTTQRQGGSDS